MGKRSSKHTVSKQRTRRRSGQTPTPGKALDSASRQDDLWTEVLGADTADRRVLAPRAACRKPKSTELPPDPCEQAFFDRGVSLQHATLIDDLDGFDDLDRPAMRTRVSVARKRALQAVVGAVLAAATAVLLAGFGRSRFAPHMHAATRLAPSLEAARTACDKAVRIDKHATATSKTLPGRRR
jgi:hypothetical protein